MYRDLTEIPSIESLLFQKFMSFLNARTSKMVCKRDTMIVTERRIGSVSRNMRFISSKSPPESSP